MDPHGTLDPLERKWLGEKDLIKERDSDEEQGGRHARYEIDSDFSWSDDDESNAAKANAAAEGLTAREDIGRHLTKFRDYGNTGPKGVKADYEEAKKICERRLETKRMQADAAFQRAAYGTTMKGPSYSLAAQMERANLNGETVGGGDADDEYSDDSDDEFLKAYRANRILQLRVSAELPQYGTYKKVTPEKFVEITNETDPRSFVVVHVFEEYIPACQRLNNIFDILARRYRHVRFIGFVATSASQTLSHKSLPAMMVYRAGTLVNRATAELVDAVLESHKFTAEDIEGILACKYGIPLPGVDVNACEKDKALGCCGAKKHS